MSYNTLRNYYEVVAALLVQQHNFTVRDIEDMIPFERDIYVMSVNNFNTERAKEAGVRDTWQG